MDVIRSCVRLYNSCVRVLCVSFPSLFHRCTTSFARFFSRACRRRRGSFVLPFPLRLQPTREQRLTIYRNANGSVARDRESHPWIAVTFDRTKVECENRVLVCDFRRGHGWRNEVVYSIVGTESICQWLSRAPKLLNQLCTRVSRYPSPFGKT